MGIETSRGDARLAKNAENARNEFAKNVSAVTVIRVSVPTVPPSDS
jgi:hypothetical protein